MNYHQTDLVDDAEQAVIATGQQLAAEQTVMIGVTEVCFVLVSTDAGRCACSALLKRVRSVCLSVHLSFPQVQEKRKVIVQYSGDQPPSLQELVDSGQLPQEALEDEVIFERVQDEGGVVQSEGSEQRTVTVYREQHGSGGHESAAGEDSTGQFAVWNGMTITEGQRNKTVAVGQTIGAGGEIEVR